MIFLWIAVGKAGFDLPNRRPLVGNGKRQGVLTLHGVKSEGKLAQLSKVAERDLLCCFAATRWKGC
jgi:hypothetical protein